MTEAIIPGGTKTAIPYEYRAAVRSVTRNDTLVWLEEQERDKDGRCRPDPKVGP